jgi:hypothetical protein
MLIKDLLSRPPCQLPAPPPFSHNIGAGRTRGHDGWEEQCHQLEPALFQHLPDRHLLFSLLTTNAPLLNYHLPSRALPRVRGQRWLGQVQCEVRGCIERLSITCKLIPAAPVTPFPQPHQKSGGRPASKRRHENKRRGREVWAERRVIHFQPSHCVCDGAAGSHN